MTNIAEILKDCPKGTKLYSPICGECELLSVKDRNNIAVESKGGFRYAFSSDGKNNNFGECTLFPSKESRDWSTFKPQKEHQFKPFDKVLVRQNDDEIWKISLYGFEYNNEHCCINTSCWEQCIPYEGNQELLGTCNKPK